MADIAHVYRPDLVAADLGLQGGVLAAEEGLETAIIHSLFTDTRALPDDRLPEAEADRRGWWGDAMPPNVDGAPADGDKYGSRLWLLHREKQLPEVLRRAREYIEEALTWVIEDGIAERVEVETFVHRPGVLGFTVVIPRPSGAETFTYQYAWRGQAAKTEAA